MVLPVPARGRHRGHAGFPAPQQEDLPGDPRSKDFKTGEWRTSTPVFDKGKCKQCLLCAPVCPDGCIPVTDGRCDDFDMDHCKGCGICEKACPFGAISMR
ncbi:MAG: 4Fe-4S binding protein [Lachnospiraceae bacterium]|nr:4Fe-4S binding protein [Lachnospiraceae bacterium]